MFEARTQDGYRFVGRLLFAADDDEAAGMDEGGRPLHNVAVEIWLRRFLSERCVGSGCTDADGRIDVPVEIAGVDGEEARVSLRICDSTRRYDENGVAHEEGREVFRTALRIIARNGALDAGTLSIPFWPYRRDTRLARAGDMDGRPPQAPNAEHKRLLDQQKRAFVPLYLKHCLLNPFRSDGRELKAIQADYPLSLTQRDPEASRTDAWLGQRVLNGLNLAPLGRDAQDPQLYRIKYAWGETPADDKHDLCDVDASFRLEKDMLLPVRITLALRTPKKWDPPEIRTFCPGDSQWAAAKRVFRVHYFLHGEIYAHIAKAHLQMEQYAIALFRNLRRHPVRFLLAPHLQEVVPANRDGDDIAWGAGSVLTWGSALGTAGVQRRVFEGVVGLDWTGWRPRQPLCDSHLYARGAALFWELFTEYVERFFAENAAEIAAHWIEVHRFSQDLVAHSPPYRADPPDPDITSHDLSELGDTAAPRATVHGEVRSIRPMTSVDAAPSAADLENLKQVCRYVLFHTTYYHSFVHDRQHDDGGEIAYAGTALRNGSLGAEDDPAIAPTPKAASFGILTTAIGTAAPHGLLLADESRDQPPQLMELVKRYQPRCEAIGIDVQRIRSRINI